MWDLLHLLLFFAIRLDVIQTIVFFKSLDADSWVIWAFLCTSWITSCFFCDYLVWFEIVGHLFGSYAHRSMSWYFDSCQCAVILTYIISCLCYMDTFIYSRPVLRILIFIAVCCEYYYMMTVLWVNTFLCGLCCECLFLRILYAA